MKKLDYFLQNWRYSVVEPFIPVGSDILDIGGYDGSLLFRIRDRIKKGFCIDPLINSYRDDKLEFIKDKITETLPFPDSSFDVVTMLAVFEHLGENRDRTVSEAHRVLKKDGIVILTIPSRQVDDVLKILSALRLIDGMSVHEHTHIIKKEIIHIFENSGLKLVKWERFQLGLNNFCIFRKIIIDSQ